MARHAGHPSCESAMGRTVTSQSPIHTEENILRQVLGFRSVSREPVANVKDAPAVTAHKFFPGRPVALEALLDQLGILLQRIISLITCYGARRVCEPAALSKSRLAAHLGLPIWNVKCSRNVPLRIRPWLPTVLTRILLTSVARHKRANRGPQAYTPSEDCLALKVVAGRRQAEGRQELRRSPYIIQYNSLSICSLNLFTKCCWLYALTARGCGAQD